MADGQTINYQFVLPEVDGSDDTWGDKLNQNWTDVDGVLNTLDQGLSSLNQGLSAVGQDVATLQGRTLTAGNGLTGGGTLAANRTFALGTPGTLNGGTSNAVTASSHTHAINSTTSRTDSSTTTLLAASAMNSHRTSGDHDGRYYQKSEFSSDPDASKPVTRTSSADIWARLFRTKYTITNPNIAVIYTSQNNDGTDYMRPSTPVQVMDAVGATRTISSGDGLTGGGNLGSDRTITLGTPQTVNGGTSNSVTATSHTHAVSSTASRTSSSTTTLLQAAAMNSHRTSGDHDARYPLRADDTGWSNASLRNGWGNFGSGYQRARYKRTLDGTVFIEGLIRGGAIAPGAVLFTLPPGYRPNATLRIVQVDAKGPMGFNIESNGKVTAQSFNTNIWASITCSFQAS